MNIPTLLAFERRAAQEAHRRGAQQAAAARRTGRLAGLAADLPRPPRRRPRGGGRGGPVAAPPSPRRFSRLSVDRDRAAPDGLDVADVVGRTVLDEVVAARVAAPLVPDLEGHGQARPGLPRPTVDAVLGVATPLRASTAVSTSVKVWCARGRRCHRSSPGARVDRAARSVASAPPFPAASTARTWKYQTPSARVGEGVARCRRLESVSGSCRRPGRGRRSSRPRRSRRRSALQLRAGRAMYQVASHRVSRAGQSADRVGRVVSIFSV